MLRSVGFGLVQHWVHQAGVGFIGGPVGGPVYPSEAEVAYAPTERAYDDQAAAGRSSPARERPATAAPAWFDSTAIAESKKASGDGQ